MASHFSDRTDLWYINAPEMELIGLEDAASAVAVF